MLEHWLAPVTKAGDELLAREGEHGHLSETSEWCLLAFGAAIALLFARRGFRAYREGAARDEALQRGRPKLAEFLAGAWQVDKSYHERIVLPLRAAAATLSAAFDLGAIDAAVDGAGRLAGALGQRLRSMADGQVKSYALWMGMGAAGLSLLWVLS
jgi:NADH:ubiquinone oxidoreductase subunit 5 (subunit L)/multisubunit Na+/H+ antiporter MnhA subunit